jgi:hypothetical protein
MSVHTKRLVIPMAVLLVAACSTGAPRPEAARSSGGVVRRDGAIILTGVALDDGRGTVLSAMQGKVPNLRIQRHSGECPQVNLRSNVTFRSVVNPHVYVDGTRISDTCILESLRTDDVSSVEVYPMGVTKRPGYATHAHGLILVFMRSR